MVEIIVWKKISTMSFEHLIYLFYWRKISLQYLYVWWWSFSQENKKQTLSNYLTDWKVFRNKSSFNYDDKLCCRYKHLCKYLNESKKFVLPSFDDHIHMLPQMLYFQLLFFLHSDFLSIDHLPGRKKKILLFIIQSM